MTTAGAGLPGGADDHFGGGSISFNGVTVSKSYNATTGVLSVSKFPYASYSVSWNGNSAQTGYARGNVTLKAYAIASII